MKLTPGNESPKSSSIDPGSNPWEKISQSTKHSYVLESFFYKEGSIHNFFYLINIGASKLKIIPAIKSENMQLNFGEMESRLKH